jgi:hypothetical protein
MKHLIVPLLLLGGFVVLMTTEANAVVCARLPRPQTLFVSDKVPQSSDINDVRYKNISISVSNIDHRCGSRARMLVISPPCLWHLSVTESSLVLPPQYGLWILFTTQGEP